MTRPRLGLLGLCAVIFSVMAISASSAQARFSWLALNAAGTVSTEVTETNLLASVVGESDTKADLTLLTKALGLKIIVTCTGFTLVGVNLEAFGKLSNGKVKFTGCEAYESGTLTNALECHVHTATTGVNSKEVITEEVKGDLVLHEVSPGVKEVLIKTEPVGAQFVTILMEICSLPASTKITGALYLKDAEGKATTHEVRHLVEPGPLTSLNYGTNMTTEHLETALDGSVWIKLGGAHAGLKWAGMDSAEAGFSWLVLNATGTVATEVTESGGVVNLLAVVAGESDTSKDLTLLTKALGFNLIITCGNFELIGINLEAFGKLSNGKAKFTGCEAYESGTLTNALECHVHTAATGVNSKEIITEELKGELVLHELASGVKEVIFKTEPASTLFVTILTENCSLPSSNKITGVLYLKDAEGKATTHEVRHLVEPGPLTSLNYGTNMTTEHLETALDGSVWIKLGGAHAGLKWAGMDV